MKDITAVLGEDIAHDLQRNSFFEFFSNEEHYIQKPHVSQAVLCFNMGQLLLDEEPLERSRETHVLSGDYLFSKFYSILAAHSEFKVLFDISELSMNLTSTKSHYAAGMGSPSQNDLRYLLFAPLEYLLDNGYAHSQLDDVIQNYMSNLQSSDIPYFIKNKGEQNG